MNQARAAFCVNGPCVGQTFPILSNSRSLNVQDPSSDEFDYHTYTLAHHVDETGTVDAIFESSHLRPYSRGI